MVHMQETELRTLLDDKKELEKKVNCSQLELE